MNICPPAWVSPPLLSAITADTEELIQGNWMLPDCQSLHIEGFWRCLLSVGNCLSYLYCLQPKGKQESWQWHWSKTGVVIEAGGYDSYLINLDGSPEDNLSSPRLLQALGVSPANTCHTSQYGPHQLQSRHLHFPFSIIFPALYPQSKMFST